MVSVGSPELPEADANFDLQCGQNGLSARTTSLL